MARQPRVVYANARYHVFARAVEGELLFRDDADRERALLLLAGAVRRYRLAVLGYSLVGNHLHLVVRTPGANISRALQWFLGCYAQGFNRRHGRRGHLFGDRFACRLTETLEHLLEALRYVAWNRTRAGLASHPDEDRWSSHRAVAGLERAPPWLAARAVLRLFGPGPAGGRNAYRAHVAEITARLPRLRRRR